MTVHFGDLAFEVSAYHEDDILWLERLGGFGARAQEHLARG